MNSRSVLFLSQWFPPEHAPMGYMLKELAENLAAQGWDVEVVTGFPNHPSGKVQAPYIKQRILRETLGPVRVTRLWLYTSETRSFLSRALNFLSFVASSFLYLLTCKKPGLVFAVLQPLPLGATLTLLAKLRGFKLIFNVQDLHPDVLVDLGLIKSKPVIKALKWIERTAYRRADGLAVICQGFKNHVAQHGAQGAIEIIPNWIDIDEIKPQPEKGQLIRDMANIPAGAPVVLYAGTIGHVSGAQVVMQAAKLALAATASNCEDQGSPGNGASSFDTDAGAPQPARMSDPWETLRLLADPTRSRILHLLHRGELAVGELQEILGLPQSRISTHLALLRKAQLVNDRRDGKKSFYSLARDLPVSIVGIVDAALAASARESKSAADQRSLQRIIEKRRQKAEQHFNLVADRLGRNYCPGRSWEAIGQMLFLLTPRVRIADLGAGDGNAQNMAMFAEAMGISPSESDVRAPAQSEPQTHRTFARGGG